MQIRMVTIFDIIILGYYYIHIHVHIDLKIQCSLPISLYFNHNPSKACKAFSMRKTFNFFLNSD